MKSWGLALAMCVIALGGCVSEQETSDLRVLGEMYVLSSAKPVDETAKCMAARIDSGWSQIYPDPVRIEVAARAAEGSSASLTIYRQRRTNSVLNWEEDALWIFDLQATASGSTIQVFEARNNPFYADSRRGKIKAAFQPCTG